MNPRQEAQLVSFAVMLSVTLVVIGGVVLWSYYNPAVGTHAPEMYGEDATLARNTFNVAFVSGTEYAPNQEGQVIVEARYSNGSSAIQQTVASIIVDEFAQVLYDNASFYDRHSSQTINGTTYPALWAVVYGKCDWTGSTYRCGYKDDSFLSHDGMYRRRNGSESNYVLGYSSLVGLGQYTQGGDLFWNNNAQTGIFEVDTKGIYRDTIQDGVKLYLPTMTLYEVNDGSEVFLGNAADWASQAPNTVVWKNLTMYVIGDKVVVEVNGGLVFNETLSTYRTSENTTYMFYGEFGSNQVNTQVYVNDVYDIVNQTTVEFGNETNCKASVWYPDKQQVLVNDEYMFYQPLSENAYIDFIVPNVDGVYEYQSSCTVDGITKKASKSFHVTKKRISAKVIK